METDQAVDKELWEKAHKRAGFKIHFSIYILVIAFLWVLWVFLGFLNKDDYNVKWPIFPMLGWGLGVFFHYLAVYRWKNKLTQKEYDKLLKRENK